MLGAARKRVKQPLRDISPARDAEVYQGISRNGNLYSKFFDVFKGPSGRLNVGGRAVTLLVAVTRQHNFAPPYINISTLRRMQLLDFHLSLRSFSDTLVLVTKPSRSKIRS